MSTVKELMRTDWWGPCLPDEFLEKAWSIGSKDIRIPRTCSEEPTRDPDILQELFGRPLTAQEREGASYAYCREMKVENCHWKVPEPEVIPLGSPFLFLLTAVILVATTRAFLRKQH